MGDGDSDGTNVIVIIGDTVKLNGELIADDTMMHGVHIIFEDLNDKERTIDIHTAGFRLLLTKYTVTRMPTSYYMDVRLEAPIEDTDGQPAAFCNSVRDRSNPIPHVAPEETLFETTDVHMLEQMW